MGTDRPAIVISTTPLCSQLAPEGFSAPFTHPRAAPPRYAPGKWRFSTPYFDQEILAIRSVLRIGRDSAQDILTFSGNGPSSGTTVSTLVSLAIESGFLPQYLVPVPVYNSSSIHLVTSSSSAAASPGRVGRYCRATYCVQPKWSGLTAGADRPCTKSCGGAFYRIGKALRLSHCDGHLCGSYVPRTRVVNNVGGGPQLATNPSINLHHRSGPIRRQCRQGQLVSAGLTQ